MAENSTGKQRGKPFEKGQSGNPAGKPKGTKHKATRAAEALLDGEAEALTRKAIERALEGDGVALRLCLERIIPPRKDRPIAFTLPPIEAAADAAVAMGAIVKAVSHGELTPGEAGDIGRLLDTFTRTLEATELEKRLRALEEKAKET
jgi:hypothetical protein